MSKPVRFSLVLSFELVVWMTGSARAQPLPGLNIDRRHVYVTGISSGGAMAMQLDVAYSRVFKGAAIYAGLPFDCSRHGPTGDPVADSLTMCAQNVPPIDVTALEAATEDFSRAGTIDSISNLKGQPVYLWAGILDSIVRQPVMDNVNSYYLHFGANVFKYDNGFLAEHAWESPYGPNACQVLLAPWVSVCTQNGAPYDSQQVFLSKWLGTLRPKNEGVLDGTLSTFDQNEYVPDGGTANSISMDNLGYVFAPRSCAAGKRCSLILAIHGCSQYAGNIGLQFVEDNGLNQWADTNDIVVLYPQTIARSSDNSLGCWDWWGYTNSQYDQKNGPQMRTLFNMLSRIAGSAIPRDE
jgi:poly(3-hydroxybutyrate) depolymerase